MSERRPQNGNGRAPWDNAGQGHESVATRQNAGARRDAVQHPRAASRGYKGAGVTLGHHGASQGHHGGHHAGVTRTKRVTNLEGRP